MKMGLYKRATQYTIDVVPHGHYLREQFDDMDIHRIEINDRETDSIYRWGVYNRLSPMCYNFTTEQWDYEPSPSSRDEEWFTHHRADFDTAEKIAFKIASEQLKELEAKYPKDE